MGIDEIVESKVFLGSVKKMSKRNVLLIGPDYSCKGGIASVIKNIIQNARSDEVVYTFVSVRGDGSRLIKLIQSVAGFFQFAFCLLFRDVSLVHAHPSEYYGFWRYAPFFFLARLLQKPVIFHMHGGSFDQFFENSSSGVKNFIRFILCNCSKVIVLSPVWKKYYESIGIFNTTIIPNAVKVYNVNKYKINANEITYMGFIEKRKGVFDLLEAFYIIKRRNETKLNFCGSGNSDELELIERIRYSDCSENIIFHGWVSDKQRDDIFAKTSVFVLPSYFEALPMAVIEAMAYGIPVIATNVGSIPDVIENGINGILVEPGNINALVGALNLILDNVEVRQYMSFNAFNTVKNEYTMAKLTEQLTTLYNSIINSNSSP